MKISRKQLRQFISLTLNEMAYRGASTMRQKDKLHISADDPFGWGVEPTSALGAEIEPVTDKTRDATEKYFKSKKFNKQASHFYGETRAFPESDVWVLGFIGNEHAAYGQMEKGDMQHGGDIFAQGYQARNVVPGIDSIGGGMGTRMMLYDITDQRLKNLNLEAENVNHNKDIILMPIATAMGKAFYPSVHMIIHAMLDDPYSLPKELESISGLLEFLAMGSDNPHVTTTKNLRDKAWLTETDYAAEVIAGALLYQGGIDKLPFDENIKQEIRKTVNLIRQVLKGKIAMITVA